MSVKTTRAGTTKTCTCRVCGHVFNRKKLTATCSSACKAIYTQATNLTFQAIHQGASNNDSTIEHPNSR